MMSIRRRSLYVLYLDRSPLPLIQGEAPERKKNPIELCMYMNLFIHILNFVKYILHKWVESLFVILGKITFAQTGHFLTLFPLRSFINFTK